MPYRNAASVLPEPVGAWIRTFPPRAIAGQPSSCAGVGPSNACSNQRRVSAEKTSSVLTPRRYRFERGLGSHGMTYSIVARDPENGELGVAVQSRAFNTGAVVPWGAPGVGVVATPAYTEPSYGPLGLELLRDGKTPDEALAQLVAADKDSACRQVAILGAGGQVAVHIGEACIPAAGFVAG